MATMPPRVKALEESVNNILPQCDELRIYLNEFGEAPSFLDHPKIIVFESADHAGDLGDVGKFYTCPMWHTEDAYIFTVDDKIIYPQDYTERTIEAIEKYNRKVVVGYHGRNLKPNCHSYYYDYEKFFLVYGRVLFNEFVHELGTGAMAFHTSTIPPIDLRIFPTINMTDIWFSMYLQKQKIPMAVINHAKDWIRMSKLHDDSYSIHAQCNQRDQYQTQVVNSFNWKINTYEP
jgi:hypothetical protein